VAVVVVATAMLVVATTVVIVAAAMILFPGMTVAGGVALTFTSSDLFVAFYSSRSIPALITGVRMDV
jgi:hypothetical protein